MGKIKLDGYRCERCGHVWVPRAYKSRHLPKVCGFCKSPYWNTPRKKKLKDKREGGDE